MTELYIGVAEVIFSLIFIFAIWKWVNSRGKKKGEKNAS